LVDGPGETVNSYENWQLRIASSFWETPTHYSTRVGSVRRPH